MNFRVLGVMTLAAIALAGCAKKEASPAESPITEEGAFVDEEAAAAADAAAEAAPSAAASPSAAAAAIIYPFGVPVAAAAEAADVYAAPAGLDLAAVRTKDELTAAADSAFAQADADSDGSLSQTEFYALAALMTPAAPVEEVVDDVYETAAPDAVDAVDATLPEEPSADSSALDESYAAIAGADGQLTEDDLRAALIVRFDEADANLDGALDESEAAAFAQARLF